MKMPYKYFITLVNVVIFTLSCIHCMENGAGEKKYTIVIDSSTNIINTAPTVPQIPQ